MRNEKKLLTPKQKIKKDYKIITTIILILYSFSFLLFLNINLFKIILFLLISFFIFCLIFSFKMAEMYEIIKEEERII